MITCNTIGYNGRFGNQIFQFASVYGIGKKLGYEVMFPKENFKSIKQAKTRENIWFTEKLDLDLCFDIPENFFSDDITYSNTVVEKHFHFDETLFKIQDFTNIEGYLQTEKYFEHCSNDLKEILKFKKVVLDEAKSLLPKTSKELISIHVRRGDNAIPNDFHPCIGLEFINPAIEHFDFEKSHFVVCSDDFDWCHNVWGKNENFSVIKSSSPYVDFCLLSLCNHHIISNSSFSWWSSYLSKNKNKKVIAPSNWLGIGFKHYSKDDLYRKEMILI